MVTMKGPKQVLAEAISRSLAEYFVVEPAHIETNLVTNAGLTLREVQLRPQEEHVNETVTACVQGRVSQVAFHWKWGGSSKEGGSSWVNSAELTVDGLQLDVLLKKDRHSEGNKNKPLERSTEPAPSKNTTDENGTSSGFQGYVQEQVERILDTLRLSITDFAIRLQLPPDGKGRVRTLESGGAGLSLESAGRLSNKDPLRQQLDIARIFSRILITAADGGSAGNGIVDETIHLLDPISYTAECIRVGGKRFEGGIQRGLQIYGKSNDDGIILHTGQEQISFANDLGGLLLQPSLSSPTAPRNEECDEKEDVPPPHEEDGMESSFLHLPLAALSLVFPNGTKVSMADLEVKYQMDGSRCFVQGRKGFLVNDFPLLSLGEEAFWQTNMIQSRFVIADNTVSETCTTVAKIYARHDEIESVQKGVNDLLQIYKMMLSDSSGVIANLSSMADEAKSQQLATEAARQDSISKWMFDIQGDLEFLLEGSNQETVVDCCLRRISIAVVNSTLEIESVEKFHIPGTIFLTEPLRNSVIRFDGEIFDIHLKDIVTTLQSQEPQQYPEAASNEAPAVSDASLATISRPPFVLPFGAKATVDSIKVYETDGETIHTTINTILVAIGPNLPQAEDGEATSMAGVRVLMLSEEVIHDMYWLKDPKFSAIIHPHDMGLVREVDFGARLVGLAAGYSIFDWKRLVQNGDQKRQLQNGTASMTAWEKRIVKTKIPFAYVHPLKVKAALEGEIVGTKGTTVNLPEFVGKDDTILIDLIRVYAALVVKEIPNAFKDIDVLGFNLTDAAASHIGTVGMFGALGGAAAPVGGVLGVVGIDGVRNTIKAGKKSRGAVEDDKTEFGDFFIGLAQAAKDATASGATKRGKTAQDKEDALDWALGATTGVAHYTNENKARLGGAGAGAVGFAYGFMLGGPVGAVAGALIANVATSRAIDAITSNSEDETEK